MCACVCAGTRGSNESVDKGCVQIVERERERVEDYSRKWTKAGFIDAESLFFNLHINIVHSDGLNVHF